MIILYMLLAFCIITIWTQHSKLQQEKMLRKMDINSYEGIIKVLKERLHKAEGKK